MFKANKLSQVASNLIDLVADKANEQLDKNKEREHKAHVIGKTVKAILPFLRERAK